ncbi:unnamed protein product [Didymodactylos carnosus]|uniref:Uncharacterized protein n=1 Tax=Didymodactylos carnosus TaxID=1234261 RepID=A0A814G8D9_9BILA|nr:unnamed protein product [Didymodactylos carnosus]CAF1293471.1 unnamed protein product [Didymodactylos carnosus]CAF3764643.1 unnamed protein product [Didymodactylos carnosus]CAF4098474.1 unnamed protein product [Didymodactylos carnosus]
MRFSKERQPENYYENILIWFLPIDSPEDLKTGDSYQQFYEIEGFLDVADNTTERVKPVVDENTAKYETYNADLEAMEDTFREVAEASGIEEWALLVYRKDHVSEQLRESRNEENADLNTMFPNKVVKPSTNLDQIKQVIVQDKDGLNLLRTRNEEQQDVFYYVRNWYLREQYLMDVEPRNEKHCSSCSLVPVEQV